MNGIFHSCQGKTKQKKQTVKTELTVVFSKCCKILRSSEQKLVKLLVFKLIYIYVYIYIFERERGEREMREREKDRQTETDW